MRTEINDIIIDGPVELPPNDSVDTEFGRMTVRFMLDAEHPTIMLDANANDAHITVSGVDVTVVMTLTDYGNGFEPRKDGHGRSALYANRVNAKKGVVSSAGFEVSASAKKKLFAVLPGVADKWAVGKEKILIEARRASAYHTIRGFRSDLEQAEAVVEALKEKVEDAEERYCSILRPVPA